MHLLRQILTDRRIVYPLVIIVLLGAIAGYTIMAARGAFVHHRQPTDTYAGQSEVRLDSLEITTLGPVEGPYMLMKVITPSIVELTDSSLKPHTFQLIGLRSDPYPDPPGAPAPPPDRAEQDTAFRKSKMEALQTLLGTRQIWLVRMGQTSPAPAYLFQPAGNRVLPANAVPAGPAECVNALALRKGIATMELDVPHPLHERMLGCQLRAIADADRAAAPPDSLWRNGDYNFPRPRYAGELAAAGSSR